MFNLYITSEDIEEDVKHLRIPLQDILLATNGFAKENLIGYSGFWKVYKGVSEKHGVIAVKRLDHPQQGERDNKVEIEIAQLSKYKHENIVPILGFSDEDGVKILIYRYESNGSLDRCLSSPNLTWSQRLWICLDAARGLRYLHHDVGPQYRIIHGDVKSANILLDENWYAKIYGLELSNIGSANYMQDTFVMSHKYGSFGYIYIDPDYVRSGVITKESDVYSFGVVLWEVLCGRHQIDRFYKDDSQFLTDLVKKHYLTKTLEDIIPSYLHEQMDIDSLATFSNIAYQCLESKREKRPTMTRVVEELQKALILQIEADKPDGKKGEGETKSTAGDKRKGADLKHPPEMEDNDRKVRRWLKGFKDSIMSKLKIKPSIEDVKQLKNPLQDISLATIEDVKQLQIPLQDILLATNRFADNNLIAKDDLGEVYKVISEKHGVIAVKRLDRHQGQEDKEFHKEIAILSKYRHENIVSLLGFCDEDGEKILIYRYERNGSLDRYLSNPDLLNWNQRLRICLDAARGLRYLHHDVGPQYRVIHRNVKSANILLDENWNAKISDFGLSRISPANMESSFVISNACGTPGYIDPDYYMNGFLTAKSDVYSFGVVLWEVLCGRHVLDGSYNDDSQFLTNLVKKHYLTKTLEDIIPSNLHEQINIDSLSTFSNIAYQCLKSDREKRPTMTRIVEKLQKALFLQIEAEKPKGKKGEGETKPIARDKRKGTDLKDPPEMEDHDRKVGRWLTDFEDSFMSVSKIAPSFEDLKHLQDPLEDFDLLIDNDYGSPSNVESTYLTKEYDIYSIGVLLFEVLSGRGTLDMIIPSDLHTQMNTDSLRTFLEIADQCLNNGEERPTVKQVVEQLQQAINHQCLSCGSLPKYKLLHLIRILNLSDVHGIISTPDFGGLPCLQKLTLHHCSSLEEIHPTLGEHANVVYLSVFRCHKLRMLPNVTGMKKLETLRIMYCDALHESIEIHTFMDRHASILTDDTVAAFSRALSSSASSYDPIPAFYSQWWNHDIFLSYIGEYDHSKKFVDHLYSTLIEQRIHTYKPDEALSHVDFVGPSHWEAIKESRIAIIIFTKNYAGSSRCLDELSYIMKCIDDRGLEVMSIFYDVSSSDVQEQNGEFGKAYGKVELENIAKVESWRKALQGACNLSGWSLNHIAKKNKGKYIKDIVDTVSHRLFSLISKVKKDIIGIEHRSKSLMSKLAIGAGGVRLVGVGGVGGSGKTAVASCVYMDISREFKGRCFVENVREESRKYGMKKLQQKLLSTILKKEVSIPSDEEGRRMIQSELCGTSVLIVLDDVLNLRQLESLVGSHDSFGSGSRIIITTRNEHFLSRKVELFYTVSLLSHNEAIQLFQQHAFGKRQLTKDDKMLSLDVVSQIGGLPLGLKVIGSFLNGRIKNEWLSFLSKLKDIANPNFMDIFRICYDGLQPNEKELFLDIICFLRHYPKDETMMILDACYFHSRAVVSTLMRISLINIKDGCFDMHDIVQEMGHSIIKEENPRNQENSRVWQEEDVQSICSMDTPTELNKIQVLNAPYYDAPSNLLEVVANMKRLRLLNVRQRAKEVTEYPLYLSDALRWISWENYPASSFPATFQPKMLFGLILRNGLQKVLWRDLKHLPRMKVLNLHGSENLTMTPDFDGLPNLERLVLSGCSSLEKIHSSIGYHARVVYLDLGGCDKLKAFPPIVKMRKLETLIFSRCSSLLKFPEIKRTMNGLKHLYMDYSGIDVLPSTVGRYCINLVFINLIGCDKLERIEGNFQLFKQRCVILVNARNMKN